ncbi:xanthine dehydrogenase, partial [Biomphalaria glabrata]
MLKSKPKDSTGIQFTVNGQKHIVNDDFPATYSLNDYIRDVAGLKGTKVMCREAGCGCCAVTVTHAPGGGKLETMSINSCLCPLYSVDGWQITTVEGIGNQKDGFHPIQERIAKFNGTQCGYCTPGFVMSMYGLLHQNPRPTQQEVEDSFDGHICRCTGYRSILDAMKSFATDSTTPGSQCLDIEDLSKHLCPKTGEVCQGKQSGESCSSRDLNPFEINLQESLWQRPSSLEQLGQIFLTNKTKKLHLLFGNTSTGIFKDEGPFNIYIDLHAIKDFYQYQETPSSVIFGANTTLTKLKEYMKELQTKPGYGFCARVVRHLKVLASVLVRNAGCIAGNLMIKKTHPEFPSDLFTILECLGAAIGIFDSETNSTNKYSLLEFLHQVNMENKAVAFIELPKQESSTFFRSFKITPRWQNAHAYVNAAFKFDVDGKTIKSNPSIVFGGISKDMIHATKTETFIQGKELNDSVLKEALKILEAELNPATDYPLVASAKYRKDLAINLLYKTLLELYKPNDLKLQSGAESIERSLSSGLQTFQEKSSEFPLKQAIPKLEAPLQASGETFYTNDIEAFKRELHGAFVTSTIASGNIEEVDLTEALATPGVVRYISVADIPKGGVNDFMSCSVLPMCPEEVFASKEISYAGQAIGLILAETPSIATEAAKKVKVSYSNVQDAVLDIQDAIAKSMFYPERKEETIIGNPEDALKESDVVVSGEIKEGTQYYFYLENQVSIAVPTEDGIDLYPSTQWPDMNQKASAAIIGKPFNYINVINNRIGGGFGGKVMYSSLVSAAATLASYVTRRPVRVNVDLSTNMKLIGKRFPIYVKYKAGFSRDGKLKVIDLDMYIDSGFKPSLLVNEFVHSVDEGYFSPNWKIVHQLVKTNKPTAMPCRAPGSVPASLVIESILEHAAKEINMHPILFKEVNLYEKGQVDILGRSLIHCTVRDLWYRLKQVAEVTERMRQVGTFNQNNLWRKRGITMCAVKYHINYFPPGHTVNVSIFSEDGTVNVMTSGTEMGQGLHTKMIQAVAKTLNIPLHFIKVRPSQNNVIPNPTFTGGSSGSELCVKAAINACNEINQRIQPIRDKMPDADWPALLKACFFNSIDLSARAKSDKVDDMFRYHTYCAGVVETEVDVLTGEYQVRRVDIMADFGESINPIIDIGQVEGAFVMGLGAYLTEDFHYDKKSGLVLNDGTWEYKPPTTKDIPIDWRIHFMPDTPNPVGILSSK